MTTFLFWNINGKPLHKNIASIVQTYHVDVVMLAEYDENKTVPGDLLQLLNQYEQTAYYFLPGETCKKIWIFSRFSDIHLKLIDDGKHFTARHLTLPGLPSILMVISHLPSKLRSSEFEQALEMPLFAQKIRQLEQQVNHARTILVGDLNMNPFEHGVTYLKGLHATLSLAQAKKGGRKSGNESYPYFYNPMWNFFGDFTPGSPGTYYYDKGKDNFWHIFDQVMLRPALLDYFNISNLQVLDNDGEVPLLEEGVPKLSDHLPILFTLTLPQGDSSW